MATKFLFSGSLSRHQLGAPDHVPVWPGDEDRTSVEVINGSDRYQHALAVPITVRNEPKDFGFAWVEGSSRVELQALAPGTSTLRLPGHMEGATHYWVLIWTPNARVPGLFDDVPMDKKLEPLISTVPLGFDRSDIERVLQELWQAKTSHRGLIALGF